jgi:hypothetical protein
MANAVPPLPPVAWRLCLGDVPVPLEVTQGESADGEVLEVYEIDFSSRADFKWLERAFGLKARSFRQREWPFLEEIREALRASRPKARIAQMPRSLKTLEVRGISLLVRNSLKALKLCFAKDDAPGNLEAFLSALRGDLDKPAALEGEGEGGHSSSDKSASGHEREQELEALEKQARADAIRDLEALPRIRSAHYADSRRELLLRLEGSEKRLGFLVPDLKRRRKEFLEGSASASSVTTAYRKAVEAATAALEPAAAPLGDLEDAAPLDPAVADNLAASEGA